MKKVKMLIAIMLALLLCVALFSGCGQKAATEAEAEAEELAQTPEQEILEYREEYIGEPIDENGNQGELFIYLPEAFEQPAVENLEDEAFLGGDVQEGEIWEDIEIDIPEIME